MNSAGKKTLGSIKVSEDVIIRIAETAACEIEGTAVTGQRLKLPTALSKLRGAVRAKISGESAAIIVDISVIDGYNAMTVAENVQESVKSAVQNMTGFAVTKVNVNVVGISFRAGAPEL